MADLFKDWLPSITSKKDYMFDGISDSDLERSYNPYMINRALSQYPDTIYQANEMNTSSHIDPKIQYDFLFHSVSKKKRFAKWAKANSENINKIVMEIYQVSFQRAEEIIDLLSDDEKEMIESYAYRGGKQK